jgi:hypothetical protein
MPLFFAKLFALVETYMLSGLTTEGFLYVMQYIETIKYFFHYIAINNPVEVFI